jgi:hypothetical protein
VSDDVTVDNGSLTDFVTATDEVGSRHFQYVKIAHGADGTATIVNDTADLDSGAGTDTRPTIGLWLAASGGGVVWNGTATYGAFVDIKRMPGASTAKDTMSVAPRTDVIVKAGATVNDDLVELVPKFKVIDHATSGDNTVVAAVSSKKIRVHQLFLITAGAVVVRFESGASGTALTGQMNVAANGGLVLPFSPMGWFETAATTLLNLELSGATSVDGVLGYTEV